MKTELEIRDKRIELKIELAILENKWFKSRRTKLNIEWLRSDIQLIGEVLQQGHTKKWLCSKKILLQMELVHAVETEIIKNQIALINWVLL